MAQWPRHPNADRHEAARTTQAALPPRRVSLIAFNFHGNHDVGQQDTRRHRRQLGHRPAHRASGRARRAPGHHRRPRPPAPGRGPEDPAAECHRQAGRRVLQHVADGLLRRPARGRHAVHARHQLHRHPFAQATEEQARSPFEGKFWPQYWAVHAAPAQTGAGRLGAADVGRGQRASRQGRRRLRRRQRRHRGLARGWPPSWRRAASTRSRPAP